MVVDLAAAGHLIGEMAQTLAFGYVVHALMRGGMNMVLPPHCGACDALVDVLGQRYAKCWSKAGIIVAHYCACCGTPFEVEAETGAVCTACFHTLPNCRRARATILYRSVNHDLVLALKMADRHWIALALGGWMSRAGAELQEDADLFARTALHRWRLLGKWETQERHRRAPSAQALRRIGSGQNHLSGG